MNVFRIGQRARVIRDDVEPEQVGVIVTITSELRPLSDRCTPKQYAGLLVHTVDMPPDRFGIACYPPEWLAPIDDGREPVAWSEELLDLCREKAPA